MSLVPDEVRCSGCEYEAHILNGAAVCIYHSQDGSVYEHHRARGWCYTCQEVRDIEDLPDLLAIQLEIADLQKLLPAPYQEIARLQSCVKAFQGRSSPARCLTCGFTNISPGVEGHNHHCGGIFVVEGNPTGIRFAMKERQFLLDSEGRKLEGGVMCPDSPEKKGVSIFGMSEDNAKAIKEIAAVTRPPPLKPPEVYNGRFHNPRHRPTPPPKPGLVRRFLKWIRLGS